MKLFLTILLPSSRIGYAVAKRLAEDGASVVISSRKEKNVKEALEKLKSDGLDVIGTTCHVGSADDRNKLVDFVSNQTILLVHKFQI